MTNLAMRFWAVMAGDAIGIQLAVFDRLDDGLFGDRHSRSGNAVGRSFRQTVR